MAFLLQTAMPGEYIIKNYSCSMQSLSAWFDHCVSTAELMQAVLSGNSAGVRSMIGFIIDRRVEEFQYLTVMRYRFTALDSHPGWPAIVFHRELDVDIKFDNFNIVVQTPLSTRNYQDLETAYRWIDLILSSNANALVDVYVQQ